MSNAVSGWRSRLIYVTGGSPGGPVKSVDPCVPKSKSFIYSYIPFFHVFINSIIHSLIYLCNMFIYSFSLVS